MLLNDEWSVTFAIAAVTFAIAAAYILLQPPSLMIGALHCGHFFMCILRAVDSNACCADRSSRSRRR